MKKRVGFALKIIICILVILSISGCWNRRELDHLSIIMGVGVDKAVEQDNIAATFQIVKPSEIKSMSKEAGGSGSKAYFNLKSNGTNLLSATRQATHEASRKLYWQHNQVVIFGMELAKAGLQKQLDLLFRDHESRLDVLVLVSKGTANEVLEITPAQGKIPAINIAQVIKGQGATSETPAIKLDQFLARLSSKTTAPIAPLVEVVSEDGKKATLIAGTAVFKQDKLVGQLDKTQTRGLLWVIDEVQSGVIEVGCDDSNDKVALEIVHANGKVVPEIRDGKIKIKVKIQETGNIGAQQCADNLIKVPTFESLKKKQAFVIESEIRAALDRARQMNTDIFGFGDAIHQHYPREWDDLKERWDEVFPVLDVEIMVETSIRGSGQATKPVWSQ